MKQRISALLFLALLSTACTMTAVEPASSVPAVTPATEGSEVVFSCALEKTKTAFDPGQGKVSWNIGDQIRIFYLDAQSQPGSVLAFCQTEGAQGSFPARIPEGANSFRAVYPASAAAEDAMSAGGTVTLSVSGSDLDGNFAQADICVAQGGKTESTKYHFSFKHAVALLKFTLSENAPYGVQVRNMEGAALAGQLSASFAADGSLMVAPGSQVSTSLSTRSLTAGEYYLPVFAGDLRKGIVFSCGNKPAWVAESYVGFKQGTVLNFGTVDTKGVTDWYFTPDGAGKKNGKDWANAGDETLLFKLLHKVDDAQLNEINFGRINNTTLHLSEGTFEIGTAARQNGLNLDFYADSRTDRAKITILGGYPAGGGTSRDPLSHETILSGGGSYRILQVRDRVDLTLKGLTFANAYSTSTTPSSTTGNADLANGNDICGAALYVSDHWVNDAANKAAEALTRPYVTIDSCVFRDNKALHTDYRTGSRSAIAIAKGCVHVNHSRFVSNRCYRHGIVGGVGGSSYVQYLNRGELFFNACSFEGNGSDDQTECNTVLYNNAKGTYVAFNNCSFRNNTSTERPNQAVLDVNRNLMVSNCTFVENLYNRGSGYDAVIHIDGDASGCMEHTLVNNIILDEGCGHSLYVNNGSSGATPQRVAVVTLYGGNLLQGYENPVYPGSEAGGTVKISSKDVVDDTFSVVSLGLVWDDAQTIWKWNGLLAGFNPLSTEEVTTALRGNSDVGNLFYDWLVNISALDKDALGNDRGAAWTPGAYQAQ